MGYREDHATNPCTLCGTAPGVLCEHDEPSVREAKPEPDQRIQLIAAYRQAGLIEKANELTNEILQEQGINPDTARAKLDEARDLLDKAEDKLADLFGQPRKRRRKRRK